MTKKITVLILYIEEFLHRDLFLHIGGYNFYFKCCKYYNQRGRSCSVAVSKDKIVGIVAMVTTSFPGVCPLQRLSVLSAYKRGGIAKWLF